MQFVFDDVSVPPVDGLTYWERAALSRWGRYVSEVERRGLAHAMRLAGEPGNALEIGCEGGRWSKMLADAGWAMTCIDVDAEALSVCQRRIPGARCLLASPTDQHIPVPDNHCSLLLCIEVPPVTNSHWFLPEARRVLKPGGVLCTVLWNTSSLRGVANSFLSRNRNGASTSYYRRSYRKWQGSASTAGFELHRETGFCWGPFGRQSNSPLVPVFTTFEKALRLHRWPGFSPWVMVTARRSRSTVPPAMTLPSGCAAALEP